MYSRCEVKYGRHGEHTRSYKSLSRHSVSDGVLYVNGTNIETGKPEGLVIPIRELKLLVGVYGDKDD